MTADGTQDCTTCGQTKPIAAYYNNPKTGAPRRRCRACMNAYQRDYIKANPRPSYHREWYLRRTYGITDADFHSMGDAQEWKCAICKIQPEAILAVDHCHTTKAVRGLLCYKCNTALGLLEDDPTRMANMIEYILPSSSARPNITPVPSA